MGLMDHLKKATGLGLSHGESYSRAYEKGVLLGPSMYGEAVKLFDVAAKKAGEAGDAETQTRSTANARLYGFITSGDAAHLPPLRRALEALTQIEAIGSQTEAIAAAPLRCEIEGRMIEVGIGQIGEGDHAQRAVAHQRAAEVFRQIFQHPLTTYRYQKADQHTETAQSRFFLHQGLASWHTSFHAVLSDPEAAAEQMGKALSAFRQCGDDLWADKAQAWLTGCRQRRTCWLCHRECQGAGIHYDSYPATVTPYVAALVTKLGQDVSTLDLGAGRVVLCRTCGSSMEGVSQRYAREHAEAVRAEAMRMITQLANAIEALDSRVRTVEIRSVIR